jgi:hypothetical protein
MDKVFCSSRPLSAARRSQHVSNTARSVLNALLSLHYSCALICIYNLTIYVLYIHILYILIHIARNYLYIALICLFIALIYNLLTHRHCPILSRPEGGVVFFLPRGWQRMIGGEREKTGGGERGGGERERQGRFD